ncbi:PRKR-interacting protein 1 homolog isoform X2 [Culex pipiens pallens]|uniref:PRKR-interacting protein 1 homolog isoform X2 n=1 Tax=Culex pipiens pallens TaxID=42434 RepID=UPI0019548BB2|nr:PRKR-interacting protein 1 homolog isoform X2 [Culex pipiens pallens]
MEIRNEVKTVDKDFEKKKFVVRNAADIQRAKLEKLMKNPEKPVIIPEHPKARDFSSAIPSFVRNVMGSSAGAGSGEFHVYRHLRRKEYARQKQIQEKSRAEELNDEFQDKLERNRQEAEERTAKKRAKRLKKKKAKQSGRGKKPRKEQESDKSESEEEEEEGEEGGQPAGDGEKKADEGKQEAGKEDSKEVEGNAENVEAGKETPEADKDNPEVEENTSNDDKVQ